ncbi:MAG: hypothetical protein JWQ14_3702, partial [Adhaeribacter sp.]|nr:hypothetical protein [Adhaeribacter sp.]
RNQPEPHIISVVIYHLAYADNDPPPDNPLALQNAAVSQVYFPYMENKILTLGIPSFAIIFIFGAVALF